MGTSPEFDPPDEPIGGMCQLRYVGRSNSNKTRIDLFTVENANFSPNRSFRIIQFNSTVDPDAPEYNVIHMDENDQYGWHGKLTGSIGAKRIMWMKHIINHNIPSPPPHPSYLPDAHSDPDEDFIIPGWRAASPDAATSIGNFDFPIAFLDDEVRTHNLDSSEEDSPLDMISPLPFDFPLFE